MVTITRLKIYDKHLISTDFQQSNVRSYLLHRWYVEANPKRIIHRNQKP